MYCIRGRHVLREPAGRVVLGAGLSGRPGPRVPVAPGGSVQRLLAACLFACAGVMPAAAEQLAESAPSTAAGPAADAWHSRQSDRYKRNWGIDIAGVRRVSSGYMLRLSYRVVDAGKATPLFDKKTRPYLIDTKTGARLAVPAMENIGELRQTSTPVADRTYFVIFGNPGKLVEPGNRVSIVIGDFRADEIVVD